MECAYSLVEIISKYWPDSIDSLPREKGETVGEAPLFFMHNDGAELQRALFRDSWVLTVLGNVLARLLMLVV